MLRPSIIWHSGRCRGTAENENHLWIEEQPGRGGRSESAPGRRDDELCQMLLIDRSKEIGTVVVIFVRAVASEWLGWKAGRSGSKRE